MKPFSSFLEKQPKGELFSPSLDWLEKNAKDEIDRTFVSLQRKGFVTIRIDMVGEWFVSITKKGIEHLNQKK